LANRRSTSELRVGSDCHRLLISQVITNRCGGSQTTLLPTVVCEPSSASSYQRPPRWVSRRFHRQLANAHVAGPPPAEPRGEDFESVCWADGGPNFFADRDQWCFLYHCLSFLPFGAAVNLGLERCQPLIPELVQPPA